VTQIFVIDDEYISSSCSLNVFLFDAMQNASLQNCKQQVAVAKYSPIMFCRMHRTLFFLGVMS
jgi:hypothetical protein